MNQNPKIFEPIRFGAFDLKNRIVMAPLTRCRTDAPDFAPTEMNATYYAQRASAGLIVSEGTQISPEGQGYFGSPGIYSSKQIEGWRLVTDAVHKAGGKIVAQLWHVGRISHPYTQPDGKLPVAPSAIRAEGQSITPKGMQDNVVPHELDVAEIKVIVDQFARGARNARDAGFDGVEIHGANGYLIDQFLRDGSNHREDEYGGSVENRVRFALEVVDAVCTVMGGKHVGIRLSPVNPANDMRDSNPQAVFGHLIERLSQRNLAFLHVLEGHARETRNVPGFDYAWAKNHFNGMYIANNCYTRDMAIEAVEKGTADLVSFGRAFISNPDLVERLKRNAPLTLEKPHTAYRGGAEGYIDYPALA
jgi:N-ethylmaleimide reductase